MASEFQHQPAILYSTLTRDVGFSFVGEGAANVVFEAVVPDAYEGDNPFRGKLLRVPKAGTKAYSHEEIQQYWEKSIKPEFEEGQLVQQSLVQLKGTGLVPRLNDTLSGVEDRRKDFQGSTIGDVDFGMLVEDMRKRNPGDLVIEFKPKWMTQSPNAPARARRCRNCAREAARNQKNGICTGLIADAPPCPLVALMCSEDPAIPEESVEQIAAALNPALATTSADQQLRFGDWLRRNTLLKRLHALQAKYDPKGPLYADPKHPGLSFAMTVRDCTCFVRIPKEPGTPVEAKLGDLDKKNADAKWKYWRQTELTLTNEGYYECREQPAQRTRCLYEWDEWFPTSRG
ncbi:hypothetical protein GQ53DRAFT_746981 [Thozetella sp. PMI_491]|nr:hypothetical protein GQ53DRAFT_746981 [Thozetella sp. PMI_491]